MGKILPKTSYRTNTDILSAGSNAYAKKRKAKKDQVEEVVFDPAARREFLTGFHKRKLERKQRAREHVLAKQKEELRQAKMMHKKEQQERLKHHLEALRIEQGIVEEVDSDEIEAGDSEFEHKDTAKISVLEGENTLTTVTVTENLDLEDLSDEDRAFGGSTCSAKVARVNRATATPELQSSLSLTVPKKKAKTKPAPSSRSAKSKRITKFKSKKPPRK